MKRPRVALGARVEFVRLDARINARRYYAMECAEPRQLPLFPGTPRGFELVVIRGRMGTRLTIDRLPFATLDALAKKWRALVALRRRHEYVRAERKRRSTEVPR